MKYSDHLTIFSEEMHTDMKEEIIFFHQVANGDVQSIEKNISDRKFRTMGGMGASFRRSAYQYKISYGCHCCHCCQSMH